MSDTTTIRAACEAIDATSAAKDGDIAALSNIRNQLTGDLRFANERIAVKDELLSQAQAEIARLIALMPPPKFRMFDASANYILGPNYERMPLLAESRLYPTTTRGKPDVAYITGTTMPRWRAENPTASMICVDDEWRNKGGVTAAEAAEYVTIIEAIKRFDPTLKVSIYGLPLRSQNHLTGGNEAAEFEALVKANEPLAALFAAMDFGTISLYALTTNLLLFRRYCLSNIELWNRVAGDKPVYPLICPSYHKNVGAPLANTPVPATIMGAVLEICQATTEGVVHWDWAANKLDKTQPWYAEMEKVRAGRT